MFKKYIDKLKKSLENWITTILGSTAGGAVLLPLITDIFDGGGVAAANWKLLPMGLGLILLGIFSKDGATGSSAAKTAVKETLKDSVKEVLSDKISDLSDKIKKK